MAERHAGQDDELFEPDGDVPVGSSTGDRCVWPNAVEAVGRTSEDVPLVRVDPRPSAQPGSVISCMAHRGPEA
jgi:hypothetical protein